MNNKICARIDVTTIGVSFDVFIPKNIKVKSFLILINKYLNEITNGQFPIKDNLMLIDETTGVPYDISKTINDNNILEDSKLMLL